MSETLGCRLSRLSSPSFQKEKVPEIPICGGLVGTDKRSLRTWVILGKVS